MKKTQGSKKKIDEKKQHGPEAEEVKPTAGSEEADKAQADEASAAAAQEAAEASAAAAQEAAEPSAAEQEEAATEVPKEEQAAQELTAEVESLRQELEAARDRLLRLTAEFDNYRKRTLRERAELISQASGKTLESLLPVVDDFDRALASSKESQSLPSMIEGLELIRKSLYGFLKREGIEEIEAVGLELDTDVHDAVAKAPAPEEKLRGKIIDVVRKGYKLRGVVLRHAQVVVGE